MSHSISVKKREDQVDDLPLETEERRLNTEDNISDQNFNLPHYSSKKKEKGAKNQQKVKLKPINSDGRTRHGKTQTSLNENIYKQDMKEFLKFKNQISSNNMSS